MALAPAAAESADRISGQGEGLPSLVLPPDLRLSAEQFWQVCAANPEAVLELSADGLVRPMTPTGGDTGRRNARLLARLQIWADRQGGFVVFDSSTGFRLADGSVLSPDAAVVRLDRWQALGSKERRGFPPLCPDLVVEMACASDGGHRGVTALRRKMAGYISNGARLGWLLLPEERTVEIWRAPAGATGSVSSEGTPGDAYGMEPTEVLDRGEMLERVKELGGGKVLVGVEVLEGGGVLPGLRLDLAEIWSD